MKPIFGCILTAAVCCILLASCMATPSARSTEAAPAGSAENLQPKPKKERIVTEKIPLLVKEIVSLPDGSPDTIRNLSYDQALPKLIKEELSDATSKEIQEIIVYSYRDDRLSEKKILDGKSRQKSRRTFAYNAQGQIETESSFDGKDVLQSLSRYAYDQRGRKTDWTTLDGGQGVLATTKYGYRGDNLDMISLLGVSGKAELEISMDYDPAGRKISETYRTASGTLEKQNTFGYDPAGRLIEERIISPAKTVLNRNALSYAGESSVPSEIKRYDSRGSLKELVTREYATREVKKVIYE
jgi:YD repeat-containing protein